MISHLDHYLHPSTPPPPPPHKSPKRVPFRYVVVIGWVESFFVLLLLLFFFCSFYLGVVKKRIRYVSSGDRVIKSCPLHVVLQCSRINLSCRMGTFPHVSTGCVVKEVIVTTIFTVEVKLKVLCTTRKRTFPFLNLVSQYLFWEKGPTRTFSLEYQRNLNF